MQFKLVILTKSVDLKSLHPIPNWPDITVEPMENSFINEPNSFRIFPLDFHHSSRRCINRIEDVNGSCPAKNLYPCHIFDHIIMNVDHDSQISYLKLKVPGKD